MKKAKKINNVKKINNKKNNNSIISTDNEMSKLIILILVVALIFALFYVITLFVTKKDSNTDNSNNNENLEATTIQYEKILAGNILSQKSSEYYVLVYFRDDSFVDLYKSYLSYYSTKVGNAVPYYFVDMDDVFNSSFVFDSSNLNVTNAKDFKFSQTALLRIRDGKIISTYEGNEQITGKLGRMTK